MHNHCYHVTQHIAGQRRGQPKGQIVADLSTVQTMLQEAHTRLDEQNAMDTLRTLLTAVEQLVTTLHASGEGAAVCHHAHR